jgi:hypothetical protein
MSIQSEESTTPGDAAVYQIRIAGQLGTHWANRFEGMTLTTKKNGDTLLTGPVVDQAALHGLLKIVRDSGMTLVSVNRLETSQPDERMIKK